MTYLAGAGSNQVAFLFFRPCGRMMADGLAVQTLHVVEYFPKKIERYEFKNIDCHPGY